MTLKEIAEQLKEESLSARTMMERIPKDKLDWKPHEKSMSMGRLSGLVADMFGWFGFMIGEDELDFEKYSGYPHDIAGDELAKFLDKGLAESLAVIEKQKDSVLEEKWVMRRGDQIFMETTKGKVSLQTLGHLAHHRGQLSVYLRLNDIPVPPMYGPTADEGQM
ncbi:MAG: DinB family protein [Acidobacteriota bacterium]